MIRMSGGENMHPYSPDHYLVVKELEHNAYHSLFLAEELETGRSVVINTLFKHAIPPQVRLGDLLVHLHRIIAHSEDDAHFVIVTAYTEGTPFLEYVHQNSFSYERIHGLLSTYFSWAADYDKLDPYFETILSDPSQLHFHGDELITNEILFIEDGVLVPQPFNIVKEKIRTVVLPLLEHWQAPDSEKKEVLLFEVKKLLSKQDFMSVDQVTHPLVQLLSGIVNASVASRHLPVDDRQVETIEKFEKDEPVKKDDLPAETIIALDSLTSHATPEEKKRRTFIIIVAAALCIAFGMLIYPFIFPHKESPEASFTRENIDGVLKYTNTSKAFGNENAIEKSSWTVFKGNNAIYTTDDTDLAITLKTAGDYLVSLKVKDKLGLWSKEASESIYYEVKTLPTLEESGIRENVEILEKLKYKILSGKVDVDTAEYNSGDRSLKLSLEKGNPVVMEVTDLNLQNTFTTSLWMRSSDTTPVTLTLKGYNGSQEAYTKTVTMSLGQTHVWQMIELKGEATRLDRMVLTFDGTSQLWIDDLIFATYK